MPSCPRCHTALSPRRRATLEVGWCARCEGLWLDEAALAAVQRRGGGPLVHPAEDELSPDRIPPCAVCGEAMAPRRLGREAGIVVEACPGHGLWVDGDDLLHLAAFIQAGGAELTCSPEHEHVALANAFEPVFELLGCR